MNFDLNESNIYQVLFKEIPSDYNSAAWYDNSHINED